MLPRDKVSMQKQFFLSSKFICIFRESLSVGLIDFKQLVATNETTNGESK